MGRCDFSTRGAFPFACSLGKKIVKNVEVLVAVDVVVAMLLVLGGVIVMVVYLELRATSTAQGSKCLKSYHGRILGFWVIQRRSSATRL